MKVTVFGGAHPKNGEPAYKEAYDLGILLGKSGYTVLTGGRGIFTMEHDHYETVPNHITSEIIAARQKELQQKKEE